jgi:hypothetical protein
LKEPELVHVDKGYKLFTAMCSEGKTMTGFVVIKKKKWKNWKWLRTWNDETELAIEEKKTSFRKYLQDKTVEHFIEYKKQ